MTNESNRWEKEKQELREAQAKGRLALFGKYVKFSGPGWLQGAITLGGGSLAGGLYLGVFGGFSALWVQPLAMLMGVIMLSTITYVTLSTGKRPLKAINDHVNPVLGWGWAVATLMANIVWCLPQFSLGAAAVQQNLFPSMEGTGWTFVVCLVLLAIAVTVIWFYDTGSKGVRVFEFILKGMVGLVVICFFGVVVKMALNERLPWGEIFSGFVPDLSLLAHPADTFDAALAATGEYADFWRHQIVGMQRDVMITVTATAVGINMTFLLPYSMLRKGWDRESRGLAIFDLGTGLLIPFFLATTCVVIASASQFHTQPQAGVVEGEATEGLMNQYHGLLEARLKTEIGAEAFSQLSDQDKQQQISQLSDANKNLAAMLVKRDAFDLANSLERLTGQTFAQYAFGIGVLGMAISTIIILMLISGFTICEMFQLPHTGWPHRFGCLIAGIGFIGPFVWSGKTQFWLAVPTSVFGMTLLPIAYFTFLLMMNNRHLMGKEILIGGKRTFINILLVIILIVIALVAGWAIWNKVRWIGVGIVAVFIGLAVVVHFVRPPKKAEVEPQPEPTRVH